MPARTWVYVKAYVHDRPEMLDWLIITALPALCVRLAGAPWFFLRYFDASGVHLRVRFEVPRVEAERVRRLLVDELTIEYAKMDRAEFTGFDWFAPRFLPPRSSSAASTIVIDDEYVPEYATYGSAQMRSAERLFAQSSELVVAELTKRRISPPHDAKLAALGFMQTVREAFVADRDEESFWSAYREYWLGSDETVVRALRGAIARSAERAVTGIREALLPRSIAWNAAVADAAVAYAGNASELAIRQFIHLTNNRLGITLVEESYMAQLLLTLGCVAR